MINASMKNIFYFATSIFLISCGSGKYQDSDTKLLFEKDHRLDFHEVTDQRLLQYSRSIFTFIEKDGLTKLPNGEFTFKNKRKLKDLPLCEGERFGEQPLPGGFCTGFLVRDDLAVTAGHCVENDELENFCEKYFLVFDYIMSAPSVAKTTFNSSEIMECKHVVARTFLYRMFGGAYPAGTDFSIIELKSKVLDRTPIPVRKEGKIQDNEKLLTIGYPSNLPLKFVLDSNVTENDSNGYFSSNTDAFHGSSGSPVINAQTLNVEGVLVRMEDLPSSAPNNGDYIYDETKKCYRSYICKAGENCKAVIDSTRATVFASKI